MQLRREQDAGRVFNGWEEGKIYFPPTYKYRANSDTYVVSTAKSGEKRRNPAWYIYILYSKYILLILFIILLIYLCFCVMQ